MKQIKLLFIYALIIEFYLAFTIPAYADVTPAKSDALIAADLGMLKGDGNGVTSKYLATQPTRIQGAIMLLRLLGKEEEAKAFVLAVGTENFADANLVSVENRAILAYLKANPGLGMAGVGNNRFAPLDKMTESQYDKILLTALGCADGSPGDFTAKGLSAYASSKEIIVATDKSPVEWKNKAAFICNQGELSKALRTAIRFGHGIFKFAPGEYLIEGPVRTLWVGSDTVIIGTNNIKQPVKLDEMLYPNPAAQAVFITRTALPSTQSSNDMQTGIIQTVPGAKNVTISNIALSGYTVLKLDNASDTKVDHVLIHNYRGRYPNGQWCNMGYGRASASLWLFGNCSNIDITNCQIQCSSHHGLAIHTGSNQFISKNIHISGCRALYCGCGQLRGESAGEIKDAELKIPETKGFGYRDWSVAYDFCENQSVENVIVEDCYALEGWKCGFYTEPESSGGNIKNLKLIRCRSDRGGQRAIIPGSNPKATIPSETEGCNFYIQGGYFEDCISVNGEKSGWYMTPERSGANTSGDAKVKLVRCGDMGSPISLVVEMTNSEDLYSDGFWSLNTRNQAMWLFGSNNFNLDNTLILVANKKNPPIKIGYMLRQQFRESRNPENLRAIAPGGKYDVLRAQLTDCRITGTVYNLPDSISPVEIVEGASFNGQKAAEPGKEVNGITLKRVSGSTINIEDYVKSVTPQNETYAKTELPNRVFTVDVLASATVRALRMYVKDGSMSLINKLVKNGYIKEDRANASGIYSLR